MAHSVARGTAKPGSGAVLMQLYDVSGQRKLSYARRAEGIPPRRRKGAAGGSYFLRNAGAHRLPHLRGAGADGSEGRCGRRRPRIREPQETPQGNLPCRTRTARLSRNAGNGSRSRGAGRCASLGLVEDDGMATCKGSYGRRRYPGSLCNTKRREAWVWHQGRYLESSLEYGAKMARSRPTRDDGNLHRCHRSGRTKDREKDVAMKRRRLALVVLPEGERLLSVPR